MTRALASESAVSLPHAEDARLSAHIQIVGWNHRAFLESCLRSCVNQSLPVSVLYIDNASTDDSVAFVRRMFPMVRVRANAVNRGYAGGHNDGFREIPDTDVAIVLNPDVILDVRFVEECLEGLTDERVGAVAPLLLRGDAAGESESRAPREFVSGGIIDAYGTTLLSSLRAVNMLEGKIVEFPFVAPRRPLWGFTGAAVALRRRALEAAVSGGEVFDEDLFAYREDVDLSWRLLERGWRIIGQPNARALHVRAARHGEGKSALVSRLSWRNYFLVLVKSVPVRDLLRHAPGIALESGIRLLRCAVQPQLWPAARDGVRLLPRMLRKRRMMNARGGTGGEERHWR